MSSGPTPGLLRCRRAPEGRVWRGHDGPDVHSPRGEPGVELLRPGRVLRGQVVRLAGVGTEVEQLEAAVLIPFDELPVADADGAAGRAPLVAIVGIVPEQRPARELAPLEQRHEADAVAMLRWIERQAG